MVQEISLGFPEHRGLGRPKSVHSETMIQAIEVNPVSSTLRVPGEPGISQSSMFFFLNSQSRQKHPELPNCN